MKTLVPLILFAVCPILAQERSFSPSGKLYLGVGTTLSNAYSGGNLVDFLSNYAGRPVTLGTAWGFFPIHGGLLIPMDEQGESFLGVELQFIATNSQAIATFSVFGGYTVFLKATLLNVAAPFLITMDSERTLFLVVEPGLDLGIMGGSIRLGSGAPYEQTGVGVGGHAAVGANFLFGELYGVTARMGYRFLRIPETHKDQGSSTGYSSFYVNGVNGETVSVDWSGLYITMGVYLSLDL